jgi:signal transduction histidine kinase/CheY-like chemotaxis protein/HPt (histidine-containing phosphotransfer) domain-containing protein
MADAGPDTLLPHIASLRAEVEKLRATSAGEAARLSVLLDALAGAAARAQERAESDSARLNEVLEAIYAVASLDFSKRAEVRGDSPFDALATSINMLAEELDEAQRRLTSAKASAEAATVAKSRFLAQMSHEIRTPLTALLGFADMLAASELNESDRLNYAMIVRRNGEHLLAVINDILDLSKIEAQKLHVEMLDCSPAALLSDLESLMRVRATERCLGFEVALQTPIPAQMRTDPTRLRQALLNIVGNAIKFTERGSVHVMAGYDPSAGELTFWVMDTGIGMTAEQLSRLFQPFEQADLSMTRRFGGSGLGLAISQGLVSALGGKIDAESTPGTGSRFTVRLPVPATPGMAMVSTLSEAPRSAATAPTTATLFEGAVLLAEDGPDNQVLISTILRRYGLAVSVAGNGALALERAMSALAAGTPYDLVFMDMQMPIMDGYEAARRLRASGYTRPIVALTAHAMEGELERCLAAGCDAYVRKPIERGNLHAVLERYLRKRAAGVPAPAVGREAALVSDLARDPGRREGIARFVDGLADRVSAMRVDTEAGSMGSLQRLARELGQSAGEHGFPAIEEAARALEAAVASGNRAAAVALGALAGLCTRARAPVAPTAATPSSAEALVSELADDPEMAEVVEIFVQGLPKRAEAIRAAAGTGAADVTLSRLVHQLKGAAGGYGFPSITTAAAQLERELRGKADAEAVQRKIEELAGLCGRARARRP